MTHLWYFLIIGHSSRTAAFATTRFSCVIAHCPELDMRRSYLGFYWNGAALGVCKKHDKCRGDGMIIWLAEASGCWIIEKSSGFPAAEAVRWHKTLAIDGAINTQVYWRLLLVNWHYQSRWTHFPLLNSYYNIQQSTFLHVRYLQRIDRKI